MSLEQIEQELQMRLDYMAKMDTFPFEDWLRCYEVLAQVKQAQASERIANRLDNWNQVGVPVERVP